VLGEKQNSLSESVTERIPDYNNENADANHGSDNRDDDRSNTCPLGFSGREQSNNAEDERDRQQHPSDNECAWNARENESNDANDQGDQPEPVLLLR
jgi:hypothetical protein